MTPNTQSPRDYTLTFKLRIDNIKNVKEDERYIFRYYISTSDKLDKNSISFLSETSTIKKNSDGTYYTEISLDRNAIKELETQVTTNAYVYIEETASTSDDTKKEVHMVKISNLDITELIINNQNGDPIDIDNGGNNNNGNNNGSTKDDTTAKGRLPQTGTKSILFAIGIIALLSIISKAIYIKRNRELQGK
jgi:LPXTG-motif cell wall-anchored protein